MNKFKRGDRIVFVKDDDYDGIEMPEGTLATYDDDSPTGGLVRWVKLDTGERVAAYPDVIAPAEDHGTDTDRLWNIIREVDGNHDLGAGALAEAMSEAWAKGYAASDYEAYHLGTHGRTDNPYREGSPS